MTSLICSTCGKAFASAYQLKRHAKSHTGERPHACTYCSKSFSEPSHLKVHVQIHTGERPHACGYCEKTFIRNADLTSHIRVHTGEKPYACAHCPRTFSRSHHLSAHVQTHHQSAAAAAPAQVRTEVFECSQCFKRFATRASLNKHGQIHSTSSAYGARPFKCALCPKTFTYSHGLSRHARTHYQTQLFYCHLCPATAVASSKRRRSFISMAALARHLHSAHEPSLACDLCSARVFTSKELELHYRATHASMTITRVKCAEALRCLADGSFQCGKCKLFKSSSVLLALEHASTGCLL